MFSFVRRLFFAIFFPFSCMTAPFVSAYEHRSRLFTAKKIKNELLCRYLSLQAEGRASGELVAPPPTWFKLPGVVSGWAAARAPAVSVVGDEIESRRRGVARSVRSYVAVFRSQKID